jgi:hypothetical protein
MIRRTGVLSLVALTAFLLCGATDPNGCQSSGNSHIGPTGGQIAAAVAGVAIVVVGTVVLIEVHKHHHNVKGCVLSGPNGIEVQTLGDNPTTYTLTGDASKVQVGDLVRLHGSKSKGDSGDHIFKVQKISRDYGPCKVNRKPPAGSAASKS